MSEEILTSQDKEELKRRLELLQREYQRTAQRLQRAERREAVRRNVQNTIAEQNRLLDITTSAPLEQSASSSSPEQLSNPNVPSDTTKVRFHLPDSSPFSTLARKQSPSRTHRLRSKRSRLRLQVRGRESDTEESQEKTEERWREERGEMESGCEETEKDVERGRAEQENREQTETLKDGVKKNEDNLTPSSILQSAAENSSVDQAHLTKLVEVNDPPADQSALRNSPSASYRSDSADRPDPSSEAQSSGIADGAEKSPGSVDFLTSCTLIEGLPFPVEYYVRTTRRMASARGSVDLNAVLQGQLSNGRGRRRSSRGRVTARPSSEKPPERSGCRKRGPRGRRGRGRSRESDSSGPSESLLRSQSSFPQEESEPIPSPSSDLAPDPQLHLSRELSPDSGTYPIFRKRRGRAGVSRSQIPASVYDSSHLLPSLSSLTQALRRTRNSRNRGGLRSVSDVQDFHLPDDEFGQLKLERLRSSSNAEFLAYSACCRKSGSANISERGQVENESVVLDPLQCGACSESSLPLMFTEPRRAETGNADQSEREIVSQTLDNPQESDDLLRRSFATRGELHHDRGDEKHTPQIEQNGPHTLTASRSLMLNLSVSLTSHTQTDHNTSLISLGATPNVSIAPSSSELTPFLLASDQDVASGQSQAEGNNGTPENENVSGSPKVQIQGCDVSEHSYNRSYSSDRPTTTNHVLINVEIQGSNVSDEKGVTQGKSSTRENNAEVPKLTNQVLMCSETESQHHITYALSYNDPPLSQNDPPLSQIDPLLSKNGPPLSENGPPLSQNDLPLTQNDPPLSENGPPLSYNNPPLSENGPPLSENGPPLSQNDLPLTQNDPPLSENGPPLSYNNPPLSQNDLPLSYNNPPLSQNDLLLSKNGPPLSQIDPHLSPNGPPLSENGPTLSHNNPPLSQIDPPLSQIDPPLSPNGPPLSPNDPPLSPNDPPLSQNDLPLTQNGPPLSQNGPPCPQNGPPLSKNGPPLSQNGPPLSQNGPPRSQNGPPLSQNDPPLSQNDPLLSQNGPPLSQNDPPLSQNDPPLSQNDPHLSQNGPPLSQNDPPLSQNDPPLSQNDPPLSQNGPPLSQNDPPLSQNDPLLSQNGPPLSQNDPPLSQNDPLLSQNGPPLSQNGPPPSQNDPPLSQNGPPCPQNGPPLSKNGPPLSQNAPPLSQNDPPLSQNAPPLSQNAPPLSQDEHAQKTKTPDSDELYTISELDFKSQTPPRETSPRGDVDSVLNSQTSALLVVSANQREDSEATLSLSLVKPSHTHTRGSPSQHVELPSCGSLRRTHTLKALDGGCVLDVCLVRWPSDDWCVCVAGEWSVCVWKQKAGVQQWSLLYTWTFTQSVISLQGIPDSSALLCVCLGRLEITETRTLYCPSTDGEFSQAELCKGTPLQAVLAVSERRVACCSASGAQQNVQVFTLTQDGRIAETLPLVSTYQSIQTLVAVEREKDALIGWTEHKSLLIWNMKSGQLLQTIHLAPESVSTATCLRGYSYRGALCVLLQQASACHDETGPTLFSLMATNPLTGEYISVRSITTPAAPAERLIDSDVCESALVGVFQSGLAIWNLAGGVACAYGSEPAGVCRLARWAGPNTLLTGYLNGEVNIYQRTGRS